MENTITFLGTAGARFMVANQVQASGGMWLNLDGTQILVDPGPGCIVQSASRNFKPERLKAIILTHRHLDHSGDMNIMVEAMTQGGFSQHGLVFLPADALGREPVLYSYLIDYLDGLEILKEGQSYSVDDVVFSTPVRHIHPVETYGLKFQYGQRSFSYIVDSRYFDGLIESYKNSDVIIISLVFTHPRDGIAHMATCDAERIINGIKPGIAILTHFGMGIWKAHPWEVAEDLSSRTGVRVVAARDGMVFDLDRMTEHHGGAVHEPAG
ncbi:MAG: MBL fold metallo-hydrolase [Dehalococcoidales bacterium]|nr:MBL fold metallo-hydrolase [Dehalococcoidales bacterium]